MITESDIYWLTRLDGVCSLLNALAGFFAMMTVLIVVLGGLFTTYPDEDVSNTAKRFIKWWWVTATLAFVFTVGKVFVPTTRELAAIKVIPQIANNKEVQGLGSDVVDLAREWVRELKPKVKTVEAE